MLPETGPELALIRAMKGQLCVEGLLSSAVEHY